jgi:hypothetical protein
MLLGYVYWNLAQVGAIFGGRFKIVSTDRMHVLESFEYFAILE